ncbi:MAG: hypothetical protein J5634_01930 [Bacilli bacterium]|nr:hypothetical protein [Bacilli bacterium]
MSRRDLLYITIIILLIILIFTVRKSTRKKYEEYSVKSLTVFGQKVEVSPKKRVYRVSVESAEIKETANGCEEPYKIELTNGYEVVGGVKYIIKNKYVSYYYINVGKDGKDENKNKVDAYDIFIEVESSTPIKIAESCNI